MSINSASIYVSLFLCIGMVRGRKSRHGSCIACGIPFMLNSGYDVVKHPKLDAFMCQVHMNAEHVCV